MKNLSLFLFLLLFASSLYGGSVNAKVEDPNVVAGSSVTLILEASGESVEFPDIQKIGEFPIQNKSTTMRSSFKVVNGTTSQENIRQVVLTFTPDKDMVIEPFEITVDGQKLKTDPIAIAITQSTTPTPTGNEKFYLQMSVNKNEVYVGEALLLSVAFHESREADLMDFRGERPDLKDFVVKEIEGEKTSRKDGYTIHEFRYLITPTREGNLTIDPINAKVAERTRVRDNFFGTFFERPSWSQIASNAQAIQVKPLPSDVDLVGDFTLTHAIDTQKVKANKPVNLTVTFKGEGNLEDFDKLNYEIDGVTVYGNDTKVESRLAGTQMVSSWSKKFAFIGDKSFTIPERTFTLFNPKTKQTTELTVESYDIAIEGATPPVAPPLTSSTPSTSSEVTPNQTTPPTVQTYEPLLLTIVAFALGILLTLAVLFFPRLLPKKGNTEEKNPLQILYPHTNEDSEVEQMVRSLYAKKGGDKSVVIDKNKLKELIARYKTL